MPAGKKERQEEEIREGDGIYRGRAMRYAAGGKRKRKERNVDAEERTCERDAVNEWNEIDRG